MKNWKSGRKSDPRREDDWQEENLKWTSGHDVWIKKNRSIVSIFRILRRQDRNSGFRERNREERGINKVKNIWAWGRMTDQGDRGSFGEVK